MREGYIHGFLAWPILYVQSARSPSCFQDGFWNFKETSAVQLATEGTEMGVAELRYPVHASSGQNSASCVFLSSTNDLSGCRVMLAN